MAQAPRFPNEAALVVGASGGIGAALVAALQQSHGRVHALSRGGPIACDLADTASIAAAVDHILAGPPITTAIIATGLLHEPGRGPEKSLRDLDADWMARQFAVNATGPALMLAALLPRLPRQRRVEVAVLGARVGSISDNRLGGWYGYRASKAALHQIVRTAAIEWARSHPLGILAVLHPGTVATALSAPFTRLSADRAMLSASESAMALLAVLQDLTPQQSGRIFDVQAHEIAP